MNSIIIHTTLLGASIDISIDNPNLPIQPLISAAQETLLHLSHLAASSQLPLPLPLPPITPPTTPPTNSPTTHDPAYCTIHKVTMYPHTGGPTPTFTHKLPDGSFCNG